MFQKSSLAGSRDFLQSGARPALLLLLSSVAASCATPPRHSVAVYAAAAALLWVYSALKTKKLLSSDDNQKRGHALAVGALLALSQLCQRAAGEGRGVWWSLILVPWMVLWCSSIILSEEPPPPYSLQLDCASPGPFPCSRRFLLLSTVSAFFALGSRPSNPAELALGISAAVTGATALLILERILSHSPDQSLDQGVLIEKKASSVLSEDGGSNVFGIMRDVMAASAVASGVAAWALGDISGGDWATAFSSVTLPLATVAGASKLYALHHTVQHQGPLETSQLLLLAATFSNCLGNATLTSIIFTSLYMITSSSVSADGFLAWPARRIARPERWRTFVLATTIVCYWVLALCAYMRQREPRTTYMDINSQAYDRLHWLASADRSLHPIAQLVSAAQHHYNKMANRQSVSLLQASTEYERRYGMPPPPRFDDWYDFAKTRDVQIYDDYDAIHDAILPFWALEPSTIRTRVREAMGFEDNHLIGLLIRDGRVEKLEGGLPWQREALLGLIRNFVQFLPDLDIVFNAHDEPRVVVPHDELSLMVVQAKADIASKQPSDEILRNAFSPRPSDMTDGGLIPETRDSRFNQYAHQNTWIPSRLSCSPSSPARTFNESAAIDSHQAWTLTDIPFLENITAYTDICETPSIRNRHAFFDRPNAYSVAHELIPIFSESKISSFQDIPYPSLWHWYGKLFTNRTSDMHISNKPMYDQTLDPPWDHKTETLYWRGSTTGGYSKYGGWRRHHRQRLVTAMNAPGTASVYALQATTGAPSEYHVDTVPRSSRSDLVDVAFSGVGQCEPEDCHAQESFFRLAPFANHSDAFAYKHVLDMDGNAFSARFYSLLRSRSLVYKAAIFREWHDEWLVPWLHYIPLGLDGKEALEAVRYFAEDENGEGSLSGRELGKRLAEGKRQWAHKSLRREDMEAWFFRCLLEYARVVDNDRHRIGYRG